MDFNAILAKEKLFELVNEIKTVLQEIEKLKEKMDRLTIEVRNLRDKIKTK